MTLPQEGGDTHFVRSKAGSTPMPHPRRKAIEFLQPEGDRDSEAHAEEVYIASLPEDAPNPYFVPKLRKLRHSGRNDPCPCGSGKKFKHCHWNKRRAR